MTTNRAGHTAVKRTTQRQPMRQRIRSYATSAYCETILDAAERLFVESGYHEARMSDLARAAGVSVGTLYKYFPSKERVFGSLVLRGRDEFLASMRREATEGLPEDRVLGVVRTALDSVERRGGLFALYVQVGALTESDIRRAGGAEAEAGYLEYLDLLRHALTDAVEAGVVRRDVPVDLLVGAIAGAVNIRIFAWVKSERKEPLAAHAEKVVQVFLEGARSR